VIPDRDLCPHKRTIIDITRVWWYV
jgi:hypothetical protein